MGVVDLWKHCIPGVKAKPAKHFKTAENTRIAVDVICLLHAIISKPKNALSSCCTPPCVPTDVIVSLQSNHDALTNHGIKPLHVFNGCHHPMKAATTSERTDERNESRASLNSFYERGKDPNVIMTDADHSTAMKNVKIVTSRTNELTNLVKDFMEENSINYMCAPFEAE